MQFINALSLAPSAHDWLANSRHSRILHVFDQACNLINEQRDVLSIVTLQIGNGPFNLVIEDDICFSDHINVESLVSFHDNQLTLEDLVIDIGNAKLWPPRPDWEVLHGKKDKTANQLMNLGITNYFESGGLDTPLGKLSGLLEHRGLPITNHRFSNSLISSLFMALARVDITTAKAVASRLAGLGMGLTPAGDDLIIGAVYAAWIIHPTDIARVLAKEIANTAAPLTTSLSAALLRSAGKGEAGILWHKFFDALSDSDNARIQQAMDKILAIGETSGADALAGFIGSFVAWMEKADTAHG